MNPLTGGGVFQPSSCAYMNGKKAASTKNTATTGEADPVSKLDYPDGFSHSDLIGFCPSA